MTIRKATALLLPCLFLALPGTAECGVLPRDGLCDYQVFQRGASNTADIEFSGTTAFEGRGVVEASVAEEGQIGEVLPWTETGRTGSGRFEARIEGIPAGGPYAILLRVRDGGGAVRDEGRADHILVGDLWILAGQSNMEGCGILARGAVRPSRLVNVFDMADRWLVAQEPLHWKHESVDPVHSGPPGEELEKRRREARLHRWRGAGLGLPFAREMVERTGVPVGLIPCAQGATSMKQWDPALRDRGGDSLYGAMYRRFLAAGGRVRGVLWYQGEADALEEACDSFEESFTGLVSAIRRDFNDPRLPFYFVQLGRYLFLEKESEWTRIRDLQLRCESLIPEPVGMVAAVDQPLVDAIHIRTRGLIEIGRRLSLLACRDQLGEDKRYTGPRPAKIRAQGGYPQNIIITFTGARGGLSSDGRLTGFSVRDQAGKDLRIVFDQFINPDDSSEVILECQNTWRFLPFPENAFVYYGYGNDPACNLKDSSGQAAPCFGPRELPEPNGGR